ncbi:MAG: prolyl oligopeptidase family serine peptidase [Proteobacteria bacterium]|nr:prolyl oligopeptidase family serine peptidase [Pseudomonadota bacterium]MBU1138566.1 prolyl oligopeptidase family serine peptidase [Pseudomonadota bacterium]MBU1234921.1 prolyl oligopeptidase family serine peptidase [Pseudomonadota bacterium]MBU1419349.1 prolyl oligopeptidase family serine peptidase [Pseudomonadota bacterium]MBU1454293.1 prolyl oligopeptidase family serine peptidase [Pseudomonadota bacterium]
MEKLERSATRVQGFQDKEMDFQLIRQLGSCASGGASIGQCLHLAAKIESGSSSAWVREFSSLARQQEDEAQQRQKKGHRVSAGDLFLMACNSYRAAEYYSSCIDPMHRQLGISSRECFLQAVDCLAYDLTTAMIPFANQEIPVYFFKPKENSRAEKTLLIVSGFDGTLEEEFLTRGLAALKRGYNILLFAGPGQMDSYRFSPETSFIPDFEKVVTTVLDWLAAQKVGTPNKTALLGISLGGYFATRAAAHEPRIKALIANSPIIDLHAYMSAFAGVDPAAIPDEEDFGVADLPMIPNEFMNEQMKLMSANLITRFGKGSMKKTFAFMHDFRVEDDELKQITCPSLALVGEGEGGEPARQLEIFCRETGGHTDTHYFTAAQGADSHCQVGNLSYSSGIMLDWLDELFA